MPSSGDLDNIEHALATALEDGAFDAALELAEATQQVWVADGVRTSTIGCLRALAALDLEGPTFVRFLADTARLLMQHADADGARELADNAMRLASRDLGLRTEALLAFVNVGWRSLRPGETYYEAAIEARALAEATGSRPLLARALAQLGPILLGERRQSAEADRVLAEAQRLFEAEADEAGALAAGHDRLVCLLNQRRPRQVVEAATNGMERARRLSRIDIQLMYANRLGLAQEADRRWTDCVATYRWQAGEALARGMLYHVGYASWNLGRPLLEAGFADDAVRLRGFASAYWERISGLSPRDKADSSRLRAAACSRGRTAEEVEALWREGRELELAAGFALARGVQAT